LDWSGLLREVLLVMRRGRALWGLGAVSALQVVLYAALVFFVIVPAGALSQVLSQEYSAQPGLSQGAVIDLLPSVLGWLQTNENAILTGVVALVVLWAASGVFDIAATAGSISQAALIAESRQASFVQGVRDGFRVWWRTVGLLAISAIPSLVSMAVLAAVMLITVTIPLAQGHAPSPSAISVGTTANSLISVVLAVVAVPLGVLVQLGLRFVVLDGKTWKSAWSGAIDLARTHPADVVVAYLLQTAAVAVGALVFAIAFGAVSVALGLLVAILTGAQSFGAVVSSIALAGACVLAVAGTAFMVLVLVWQSVIWTVFWRRGSGRATGNPANEPGLRSV
jgi:hypothetical protein